MATTNSALHVLLVEDDDVDAMAFQRHVGKSSLPAEIHRAVDGVEALAMLRSPGSELNSPLMIVLDLNMPRMNGDEFLTELRADPALRNSVVLVLTTSDAATDLIASYDKNVAGYVLKSRVGERFETLIAFLESYYTSVEFPLARS